MRDARFRIITRKDLRDDAAKWIDKAAFLHLLRPRQRTQWQKRQLRAIHMSVIWTCATLFKAERLACDASEMLGATACGYQRERLMMKKDEEELRK